MSRVLITGSRGFIGTHLTTHLSAAGWQIHTPARDRTAFHPVDIAANTSVDQAAPALEGIDAIVHLAGIAHRQASPADYTEVNREWPLRLYQAATRAGVGRFAQISTIKVLGDSSARPLLPDDPYRPSDDYARSKAAAEQMLLEEQTHATALTILRLPLVYGPGVGGSFRALLRLAALGRRGMPVPLGAATAPRSLVSTSNVCTLIHRLLRNGSGVYHVRDREDWSVAEILAALGVSGNRLWRVPPGIIRAGATAVGRKGLYQRLFDPLQVDQSATLRDTGWSPDANRLHQLEETFRCYLSSRSR